METNYSYKRAKVLEFFLQKTMSVYAEYYGIVASLKKNTNYIFLLPNHKRTNKTINKLSRLLEPETGYLYTDDGGVYFRDTFFGNIEIHFTKQK